MERQTRLLLLGVLIPVAVLAGFACAGGQASGAAWAGERGQVTREDAGRRVTLLFGGERGTGFSGTCAVDGERRAFEGETPERLKFSPGDGRLECEIRKDGAGDLELVFSAGENVRSLQRIAARESAVKIRYEEGNLSTSTVSSGGSGSSSQQTIVSGSSRSVVSSSQINP